MKYLLIILIFNVLNSQCNESNWEEYYPVMTGCNLVGADLEGAYLTCAYLNNANLSGANLYASDLSHSSLIGANLSNANLNQAYLLGTDIDNACIDGAIIDTTYTEGTPSIDNCEEYYEEVDEIDCYDYNQDGISNILDIMILLNYVIEYN